MKPPIAPAVVSPVEMSQRQQLATMFTRLHDLALAGDIKGLALAALVQDGEAGLKVSTAIHDPGISMSRLALAGAVSQLETMLQSTEHNQRMASVARQPDPAALARGELKP